MFESAMGPRAGETVCAGLVSEERQVPSLEDLRELDLRERGLQHAGAQVDGCASGGRSWKLWRGGWLLDRSERGMGLSKLGGLCEGGLEVEGDSGDFPGWYRDGAADQQPRDAHGHKGHGPCDASVASSIQLRTRGEVHHEAIEHVRFGRNATNNLAGWPSLPCLRWRPCTIRARTLRLPPMRGIVALCVLCTACGGTVSSSQDPQADAGTDAPEAADSPDAVDDVAVPWLTGSAKLELLWVASVDNWTPGWAAYRFFGPYVTDEGDVLVGGSLEGTWSLFGQPHVATIGHDVIGARLAGSTGQPEWVHHFLNDAFEFGVSAWGSGGTLLLEGSFQSGPLVLGDTSLQPDPDPEIEAASTQFFARFDGQGELAWSSVLPHRKSTFFLPDVAWNAKGGIGIVSLPWGEVDFGGGPLTPVLGSIYLARLEPEGEHVWSKATVPQDWSCSTAPSAILIGDAGRVFVVGTHQGRTTLDGQTLESTEGEAVLVLAFEPGGTLLWSKLIAAEDAAPTLEGVLAGDDLVLFGPATVALDFGGGPQGGGMTGHVARFRQDGALRWSRTFGGEGLDSILVAAVSGEETTVAGTFRDALDTGVETLLSAGRKDAFVARLGAGGETLWAIRMGDEWDQSVDGIAIDGAGDLLLHTGRLDVGGGSTGSITFSKWRIVMD